MSDIWWAVVIVGGYLLVVYLVLLPRRLDDWQAGHGRRTTNRRLRFVRWLLDWYVRLKHPRTWREDYSHPAARWPKKVSQP